MSRNLFESNLKAITGDIDLNEIKDALEDIITAKEKPKNIVEWLLEEIDFRGKFRQHPLVGKAVDLGNISKKYRKSIVYKKIQEKLAGVMDRQQVEIEDVIGIRCLLRELRDVVLEFIVRQVGDVTQGLRHIHAPGSASRKEARNLYFGEKFMEITLYELASKLCSSIALGDSIGIYSEDDDFMLKMRQLIESSFGPPFKIERDKLREIGVQMSNLNYPFVVFLKFVLWLKNQIDVEESQEKKGLYLSLLSKLQYATISIFFMPPNREKWCTIALPRLDFFINNWIQNEKSRRNLEALITNIDNFINASLRKSRKEGEMKKARNIVDLLMSSYEIFCRRLIEYGVPELYALRNIMDIMIDLGTRYNIKLYLKPFTLAT